MSNARGYPPYPPRGKKPHGPSRCRFYTGPPSSRRSRDQDGRDLLYDLHTITGQSEGTHTHATQTKRREHRTGPAVREAEPEVRNTGDGAAGESNGEREDSRRATGGERGLHSRSWRRWWYERWRKLQKKKKKKKQEGRVRTWGGSRRAVLDLSPGAVGMSMSGSRRGPLSRTPAT